MPNVITRLRSPLTGRYINPPALRFTHRFKGGEVDVTLNSPAVRMYAEDFAKMVAQQTAEAVLANAKARVAPGVGPGPHPHRTDHGWTWEDTGHLQDSLYWAWDATKGLGNKSGVWIAVVGIDAQKAPYGLWLEWGWHSISGRLNRYPFLGPAFYEEINSSGAKGAMTTPGRK